MTTTARPNGRRITAADALDMFAAEKAPQQSIDAVGKTDDAVGKTYEIDEKFLPPDVREALREEVAGALLAFRAEQLRLADRLVENLITWTIGTGIAVAMVVIIAIKWL